MLHFMLSWLVLFQNVGARRKIGENFAPFMVIVRLSRIIRVISCFSDYYHKWQLVL